MKNIFPKTLLFLMTSAFMLENVYADCDNSVPAFVEQIKPQVIFVGETQHGTKEMPAFAANLMCYYAKKKMPVLVGLEMSSDMQTFLNSYHFSKGEKEDKDDLLAAPFWRYAGPFGIASTAIFDLLELARKLKNKGYDTIPFAYDNRYVDLPIAIGLNESLGIKRDFQMAANIFFRASDYKNYKVIILSGSGHAIKGRYQSSAASFLSKHLPVFSIGFHTQGGNSWSCGGPNPAAPECGIRKVGATSELEQDGFDAVAKLGELHVSPPAIDAQKK